MDTGQLMVALEHLSTALRLLDQIGAPAQIGAHVDLAVHQLEELVATEGSPIHDQAIETNAEPH